MIRELDTVVLDENVPAHSLEKGDLGTVVLVHQGGAGYEVEFCTLSGDTIAVVTLRNTQIRAIQKREIAHARAV